MMKHQSEHQVVLAGDKELVSRVERLLEENKPFIIRADSVFRHTKRLIRYLKFSYEGMKGPGRWTMMLSLFFSRKVVLCKAVAEIENNYSWRYEYTPEGVDLIFDPPRENGST